MTNEQFLQQFGHFIDAPNGLQKMRELILQLAVQGKLVSQDVSDELAPSWLAKFDAVDDVVALQGWKIVKFSPPQKNSWVVSGTGNAPSA